MNIKTLQKELAKKGYNIKLASEVIEEPKIKTGIFPLDYFGVLNLVEKLHLLYIL